MNVIIMPPQEEWADTFIRESDIVRKALGLDQVHHIGSTAILGIYAKPIIDILGGTASLGNVDSNTGHLEKLGYEALGEFGIKKRRYFRKDVAGVRKFHLHVFQTDDSEFKRHLLFRDYLISHPEWAERYSILKRELVAKFEDDMDRYIDGKDAFIQSVDKLAKDWDSGENRDS